MNGSFTPVAKVAFTPVGVEFLRVNPKAQSLVKGLLDPTWGFRTFLAFWKFVDKDTGEMRCLGDVLWPGQMIYVNAMSDPLAWLYLLKARQLGLSTLECAYDGYVARFRPTPHQQWRDPNAEIGVNARVHIFSKREKDANAFLAQVKYGLERLPEWMQLPVSTDNAGEYRIDAGEDDARVLQAFPADNDTARSYTCQHAHMDEWAFMGNPEKVWQSVEPSCAGSVHFITTGGGPANFTSMFYRRCEKGEVLDRRENPVKAVFLDALKRPDRTASWLKNKAAGMTREALHQELPMTADEALSGGGDFIFRGTDLDHAGENALGMMPPLKKRAVWNAGLQRTEKKKPVYVCGWDIGKTQDAAVGFVLDVTEDVHDVVAYHRVLGLDYPVLQALMEDTWEQYARCLVAVESNAMGAAVIDNLKIPERFVRGFATTKASKARILQGLNLAVQKQLIKWDPLVAVELDREMRGYQLPDDNIPQDTVMALAIAEEHAADAHGFSGRVLGIISA